MQEPSELLSKVCPDCGFDRRTQPSNSPCAECGSTRRQTASRLTLRRLAVTYWLGSLAYSAVTAAVSTVAWLRPPPPSSLSAGALRYGLPAAALIGVVFAATAMAADLRRRTVVALAFAVAAVMFAVWAT